MFLYRFSLRFFMLFLIIVLGNYALFCQTPFIRKGQVFLILENTNELVELTINPSNSAITITTINPDLGVEINALGFRISDNLLYGIGLNDQHLYRIDADGLVADLGLLDLNPALSYRAGDISPDGQFLVAIGSSNNGDQSLVKIDLTNNFSVQTFSLSMPTKFVDLAFDPATSTIFTFDIDSRKIFNIDLNAFTFFSLLPIETENDIFGLYFDPFGDLFGFGTTISGVASALFVIDKTDGNESLITTGPVYEVMDIASCPYSVAINNVVAPKTTFPCSEIEYTYSIANQSEATVEGVLLEHPLPNGFEFLGVSENAFDGEVDNSAPSNMIRIENIKLTQGVGTIKVLVEVGNVAGDDYISQAVLKNLPANLGGFQISDNPSTVKESDGTKVKVNVIEEDSLTFDWFFCQGETLTIDASPYGNNIEWNNGMTDLELIVSEPGVYALEAVSGCQTLVVTYNIASASCPFNVELAHSTFPEETLPCSEVLYRFIIENDSGQEREGIDFIDTLPEGITFLELISNPYGGDLEISADNDIILIENMTIPMGFDSIDFLVEVGNIEPKDYINQAKIAGFPVNIGPIRRSDDPRTLAPDGTILKVLGTESDSLFIDTFVCRNAPLILDVSQYGIDYTWNDGSHKSTLTVTKPGNYDVVLFNGCEPTFIFFNVMEGAPIEVQWEAPIVEIFLGEHHQLNPIILNEDDSLFFQWIDPLDTTLSCVHCLDPIAMPLQSTEYILKVANEFCKDSSIFKLNIDNTRRIYAPNVFSPNGDGFNDFFYLQSPDFGIIHSLKVFDRWGGAVFESEKNALNTPASGWDGLYKNQPVYSEVFIWRAEIEFLDQKKEVFFGEILVVR